MSEALESCTPQSTRTGFAISARAAISGRNPPSAAQADEIGGSRPSSPSAETSVVGRSCSGAQRSVWQPSEVDSEATTPVSLQAQYCG